MPFPEYVESNYNMRWKALQFVHSVYSTPDGRTTGIDDIIKEADKIIIFLNKGETRG